MKQSEAQKRAIKKYKSGLRYKQIVFYKHEQELADFADAINFQGFVKKKLQEEFNKAYDECENILDERW